MSKQAGVESTLEGVLSQDEPSSSSSDEDDGDSTTTSSDASDVDATTAPDETTVQESTANLKIQDENGNSDSDSSDSDDDDDDDDDDDEEEEMSDTETYADTYLEDDDSQGSSESDNPNRKRKAKTKGMSNVMISRLAANDSSLTKLVIDDTVLVQCSPSTLSIALRQSQYLTNLTLEIGDETKLKDFFPTLTAAIGDNIYITVLTLKKLTLDRHAANDLGLAFAKNRTIQRLGLTECTFMGSALPVLFIGIQHHAPQLVEMRIVRCALGGFALDVISSSLQTNKQIESLSLKSIGISIEGLSFLMQNLERTPSLDVLDLSDNELDIECTDIIAKCLKSGRVHLERLVLTKCKLNDKCIHKLCKALEKNPTITSINLSYNNKITDDGALKLKDLLSRNNNIKEILVDECNISEDMLKMLLDCQRYNNSFLKNMFSTEVSLAILDSVSLIETATNSFAK